MLVYPSTEYEAEIPFISPAFIFPIVLLLRAFSTRPRPAPNVGTPAPSVSPSGRNEEKCGGSAFDVGRDFRFATALHVGTLLVYRYRYDIFDYIIL